MKRILAGLALALLIAAPVSAAQPPTGTISINQANPAFQTVVTFTVTVSKKFDCVGHAGCARVLVECYQAGDFVYGQADDLDAARTGVGYYSLTGFLLGGSSSQWIDNGGGTADCTATLFYFDNDPVQTFNVITTTSFTAGA